MTRRLAGALWLLVGAALGLLPLLPLPQWTGAADEGPRWAAHVESWAIGLVVVLVAGALAGRLATRVAPPRVRWPDPPAAVLVGVLTAGLTALSTYTLTSVFASNPHLVDEVAQLFHAKIFLAGRLTAPLPEPPDAFLIIHTGVTDTGWVSQYPPGQALLLAAGLLVHAEWLVNPILGGVSAVLIYLVARGLYGARTAKAAAVLWAVSAWVMFMSGTYANHVGATTATLAAWAVLFGARRRTPWHVVAAGLAIGLATVTRPLDGAAAMVPVAVWVVQGRRWRTLPWIVLGGMPFAILWGYINWRVYGHPLTLGYTALYGPEVGLGFHTDPWGQAFTPAIALSNAAVAIRRLHVYLYEWPIPALLPLALWAFIARQRHRGDLIVASGVLAAPALYFFYWHSGFYLGPRFYYAAVPMLVIGTARAWRWGWAMARRAPGRWVRWDVALAATAVAVLVWGWVQILPTRVEIYRAGLVSMKLHPERQLAARGVQQALVLVPESWGARVGAGLWAIGVPPGAVERAYRRMDTCDLHRFLVAARSRGIGGRAAARQLEHLVATAPPAPPKVEGWPDPTLRLRRNRALPAECRRELERDRQGFTLYGSLAWRNPIGLDHGIVFARDLFERNAALLVRYPGWDVWRFAPPATGPTALPRLERVSVASGGPVGE